MMIKNKKQKKIRYKSALHESEAFKKKNHSKVWIGIFVFFVGSFFTVQQNSSFLKISVIPQVQHAPFDGTASPVKLSPDWVHLTAQEYKLPYEQISSEKLQTLPTYRPEALVTPVENLEWGNPEHNQIRNAKITFSVPYMGSYRLNGKENDGSHAAVDIKVPNNTPVFSIANGVVIKVSNISNGFGKHVVIQHNNVPSLEDPNTKVTLYSSYSHMSNIIATEGQVVTKGQLIGQSGATGFATTPHVHFQIDKEDAPYHPYWPFTYKESTDAGLNFVESINAGLGKERGLLMTVSPLKYVEKYKDFTPSFTPVPESTSELKTEPQVEPVKQIVSRFDFQHNSSYLKSDTITLTLIARDSQGNTLTTFDGDLTLLLTGNVGTLPNAKLTSSDFSSGQANLTIQEIKVGTGRLVALYQGGRFTSNDFSITDPSPPETPEIPVENPAQESPNPISQSLIPDRHKFNIRIDGQMKVGRRVDAYLQVVDDAGNILRTYAPDNVRIEVMEGSVDLSKETFTALDFSGGEAHFTIAAKKIEPVVLKILDSSVESVNQVYQGRLFADIAESHPYYSAIQFLKDKSYIEGYEDGSFQPKKKVSRVEAIKLILLASEKNIVESYGAPAFPDIDYKAWYGPYVLTAFAENIAQGYHDQTFRPNQKVNRAEFLKMLLGAMKLDIPTNVSQKSYRDVAVTEWFAPYASYAKDKNLLPSSVSLFNGSEEIDRGEVVEIIYRVLKVRSNNSAFVADSR